MLLSGTGNLGQKDVDTLDRRPKFGQRETNNHCKDINRVNQINTKYLNDSSNLFFGGFFFQISFRARKI